MTWSGQASGPVTLAVTEQRERRRRTVTHASLLPARRAVDGVGRALRLVRASQRFRREQLFRRQTADREPLLELVLAHRVQNLVVRTEPIWPVLEPHDV